LYELLNPPAALRRLDLARSPFSIGGTATGNVTFATNEPICVRDVAQHAQSA